MKPVVNNGIFAIPTGDRRISSINLSFTMFLFVSCVPTTKRVRGGPFHIAEVASIWEVKKKISSFQTLSSDKEAGSTISTCLVTMDKIKPKDCQVAIVPW